MCVYIAEGMQPRIIPCAYADVTAVVRKKSHQRSNVGNILYVDSSWCLGEEVNKAAEEHGGGSTWNPAGRTPQQQLQTLTRALLLSFQLRLIYFIKVVLLNYLSGLHQHQNHHQPPSFHHPTSTLHR